VVAGAAVVISFSQVFSDAGLAKALIQRQDRVPESANVVFWLNLGIALVIVAVLLVSAPLIAGFFHDGRVGWVVRVLSLQMLLTAVSSVHATLMQKDLNFKQLFWVRLITTGAPALASVPLAIHGMGYWALVGGTLLGQTVQSVVLWRLSPWRPQWRFDRMLAGHLIGFGKWAMLSALLGWFYCWMDAIVVGHYLGPHDMGLYRTGNTFVTMIFGLVFSPLLPVLYSLFSRAQDDVPKLRETLATVAHGIALIALPLGFALLAVNERIVEVLFDKRWHGIGQVIGYMALVHGISWIVGANGEVYRAIGKPHIEAWAGAAMLLIYLAGYLVAIRYGLQAFLQTRLALVIVGVAAHILIAYCVLRIPILEWFSPGSVVASVVPSLVVYQVGLRLDFALVNFFVLLSIFLTMFLLSIALLERTFVKRLRSIIWHRSYYKESDIDRA
jgi:PST family polysaccharide transporter